MVSDLVSVRVTFFMSLYADKMRKIIIRWLLATPPFRFKHFYIIHYYILSEIVLTFVRCFGKCFYTSRLNIEEAVLYYCTGKLAPEKVIRVVPLEQVRKEGSRVSFHWGSQY